MEKHISAGEKFADADLIGVPMRVVVSEKSLKAGGIEVKERGKIKAEIISKESLIDHL
ncbi:MAG TPA: hypothetical protein ENI23_05165 [bacterium]|nr:hypothetical protein [bacterium]